MDLSSVLVDWCDAHPEEAVAGLPPEATVVFWCLEDRIVVTTDA